MLVFLFFQLNNRYIELFALKLVKKTFLIICLILITENSNKNKRPNSVNRRYLSNIYLKL